MAIRKVSHHRRILNREITKISQVNPGDIVEFPYNGEDVYDKKPLVLILQKKSDMLDGINLNYLKEFLVQSLLTEKDWGNLKRYSMYKDSFRSYKLSKIGIVNQIEYKMD
tara:strand:- start:107 stop:436 length:330 start_codon:yes stop_codon:yes gene_type:complete